MDTIELLQSGKNCKLKISFDVERIVSIVETVEGCAIKIEGSLGYFHSLTPYEEAMWQIAEIKRWKK